MDALRWMGGVSLAGLVAACSAGSDGHAATIGSAPPTTTAPSAGPATTAFAELMGEEIPDQNYLRGVQAADDAGRVTFRTVFPGCYPGRWPHCHFEVFASLDEAAVGSAALKTSQLAFPQADCETVFADDRYGNSLGNLSRLSLSTDGVFRDGWSEQLATVAGFVDAGYTASLLVRV